MYAMRYQKLLRILEVVFLSFAIIGSTTYYFSPMSIGFRDTSLNVRKGDSLILTIDEYDLDFTITGNTSLYLITAGIFLYPFLDDNFQVFEEASTEELSERNIELFIGNTTSDLIYNFNVLEKIDDDHVLINLEDLDINFTLWLGEYYKAHNAFAHPYMNIGLVIRPLTNLSISYIYWKPIAIFSSSTTREALNWMSRKTPQIANFEVYKLNKNQFFSHSGTCTSSHEWNFDANTTWSLFPNRNKIQYVTIKDVNLQNWNEIYSNVTVEVNANLNWIFNLTLQLEWQYGGN